MAGSWSLLFCQVLVLCFLDQGDSWGVLAEGLESSGALGAQEADIQELVLMHFNIFTAVTVYCYIPAEDQPHFHK